MSAAENMWQVVQDKHHALTGHISGHKNTLRRLMIAAKIGEALGVLDKLKEMETQLAVLDEIIEEAEKRG